MATVSPVRATAERLRCTASEAPHVITKSSGASGQPQSSERRATCWRSSRHPGGMSYSMACSPASRDSCASSRLRRRKGSSSGEGNAAPRGMMRGSLAARYTRATSALTLTGVAEAAGWDTWGSASWGRSRRRT